MLKALLQMLGLMSKSAKNIQLTRKRHILKKLFSSQTMCLNTNSGTNGKKLNTKCYNFHSFLYVYLNVKNKKDLYIPLENIDNKIILQYYWLHIIHYQRKYSKSLFLLRNAFIFLDPDLFLIMLIQTG